MKRGFTLIELVVTIGILVTIAVVTIVNISGKRSNSNLTTTTQQVATLLREAQSDSLAQEGDAVWGVHFSNATATAPFYALFSGSYGAGAAGGYYRLPATVAYKTSTLASGATLDITFSAITGAASASTSIGLYLINGSGSSTISVASTGAVSY